MITIKMADMVITGVRYEQVGSYQRISALRLSRELSRLNFHGEIVNRDFVADVIRRGYLVTTAHWNGFRWEGDRVIVIQRGTLYFIRTDGSPTTSDNLGNLPRI